MPETPSLSEADILANVIIPNHGDLTPDAAQSILRWKFSEDVSERMKTLLEKNNQGVLSDAERAELDRYRRVGMLVDLMQAKAHASLKRAHSAA